MDVGGARLSNLSSVQIVDLMMNDLLETVCDGKVRKVSELQALQAEIRELEEARYFLSTAFLRRRRSTLGSWASWPFRVLRKALRNVLTRRRRWA
jgi:hypothetical protein